MTVCWVESTNWKSEPISSEHDKYSINGVFTMAKIIENVLVVKVSKLVKEGADENLIPQDTQQALEQVAQELLGDSVIVEVERA